MPWRLVEVSLKQVQKHSHIHHKLDTADGGDAVVDVEEAADRRSDGAEQRLDGRAQPQHGTCERKSATSCHYVVVVVVVIYTKSSKFSFGFLFVINDSAKCLTWQVMLFYSYFLVFLSTKTL